MKLLISINNKNKVVENGIDTMSVDDSNYIIVSYNMKDIDLFSTFEKEGIKCNHIAYDDADCDGSFSHRTIGIKKTKDLLLICTNEDKVDNKVYAFLYTPTVYESEYTVMSLHKTKRGAFKALNKWLNERYYREYDEYLLCKKKYRNGYTFKVGDYENWAIKEYNIE